ncbi:MAG: pyridoxamine 5'-phosphate oxidase family protein [Acidimicrobiia bacterium]|nr:pyridoxamine 5'-phosphate oxidase family protein [Acidimicrobiia bacterium]
MAGRFDAYEHLEQFPLDDEVRERLCREQLECVVAWTNRDGWPVAVTHWFVWHDGRFWVTSTPQRKRVPALRSRPESCVVVSSAGTELGPARTATAKTRATVHDDDATKAWFFPALAERAWGHDPAEKARFEEMLFGTDRVVIELEPLMWITYDAMKMWQAVQEPGTVGG